MNWSVLNIKINTGEIRKNKINDPSKHFKDSIITIHTYVNYVTDYLIRNFIAKESGGSALVAINSVILDLRVLKKCAVNVITCTIKYIFTMLF